MFANDKESEALSQSENLQAWKIHGLAIRGRREVRLLGRKTTVTFEREGHLNRREGLTESVAFDSRLRPYDGTGKSGELAGLEEEGVASWDGTRQIELTPCSDSHRMGGGLFPLLLHVRLRAEAKPTRLDHDGPQNPSAVLFSSASLFASVTSPL
jgi:hypothetical protein